MCFSRPGAGQRVTLEDALRRHAQGDLAGAESAYRALLDAGDATALAQASCNLGLILAGRGEYQQAVSLWRRALAARPEYVEPRFNLARIEHAVGNLAAAEAEYRQVLGYAPDHAAAWLWLGRLCAARGDPREALRSLEKSVELNPDLVEAHCDRGELLQRLQRNREAIACFEAALRIRPDLLSARINLGACQLATRQVAAARETYRAILATEPGSIPALLGLGNTQMAMGSLEDAVSLYQRVIALDPTAAAAHNNLGNAYSKLGDHQAAVASYQRALGLSPDYSAAYSNLVLSMNYMSGIDLAALLEGARKACAVYPRAASCSDRHGGASLHRGRDVLRVGYVSGDFRNHPVGYFLKPVLAAHDRSRVAVYCYSNNERRDPTTEALRGLADHWRDIYGLDDQGAAQRVRDDRIDVLVDLSGHTEFNRLGLFALRPAPVQMTWLGYFGTTGLAEMDCIIADRFVLPAAEEKFYTERVLRMPDSYLCFSPPDCAIPVSSIPTDAQGGVTFGCFNNRAKLTGDTVATWAEILAAVPDARLLLKYAQFDDATVQTRLRAQFERHGVSGDRLAFLGHSLRPEHLACYRQVDVALDPFPYGGGTTTAEALWMGVPVVTLRGDRWTGRVSESILAAVGLDELVAGTRAAYVELAVRLAEDAAARQALSAGLPGRLQSSAFCDGPRFAAHLEALFREAVAASGRDGARSVV